MAYDIYAGDGFNRIGTLAFFNDTVGSSSLAPAQQPDFSQWSVIAALFSQDGQKQIGNITVTNMSVPGDPSTNGTYQLYASAGETAKWPQGKAQVLIRAIPPHADPITSDPIWLRIKANPMMNVQAGSN